MLAEEGDFMKELENGLSDQDDCTHSLHDFLILGFFHPRACFLSLLGLELEPNTGSLWCLPPPPGSFRAKLARPGVEEVAAGAETLSELIDRVARGTRLEGVGLGLVVAVLVQSDKLWCK